jgi:galactose mutarotase-like enzyme
MLYHLESESLCVSVSNTGAELQSILSKTTGTQYLWQGDPAYWGSRAPVLFPIIGGLRDSVYLHEEAPYTLPKHGFVRRAYFHGVHESEKLVFEYVDNPETRAAYPFSFSLKVAFALRGRTLHIENIVQNQGKGRLYFGVGAHEAYAIPRDGEVFDDYFLEFEREEALHSYAVAQSGLLSGQTYPVAMEGGKILPLSHGLFVNDALIFKGIQSKKVALKSRKSPAYVEVAYDSAHLGIWTKVGAPFICIEPWCGLPDTEGTNQAFATKEGNIGLGEGETFTFTHSVTVYE